MKYYVYYNKKNHKIMDVFPNTVSSSLKNSIIRLWAERIPRKILITLSDFENLGVPDLQGKIGHSLSTLHENLSKLEEEGLINTKMIYSEKRKKIVSPKVFFVTKNPRHQEAFNRFFQGLWVDSKKSKKLIEFLQNNPESFFTSEQISLKTKIPVDDVKLLLNNWDSPITKAMSDAFKDAPFEKKILYKARDKSLK